MASFALKLIFLVSLFQISMGARKLQELVQEKTQLLHYHNGPLLSGKIAVNIIWYGHFKPSQRAIVSDFFTSLEPTKTQIKSKTPTVGAWWKTTEKYHQLSKEKPSSHSLTLTLKSHIVDESYSLGKSLTTKNIVDLAARGDRRDAINVVLTGADVSVEGFCSSRCGTHGYSSSAGSTKGKNIKFAYIWVGNSETQCAGTCAWPFHQPIYGPQSEPLVAPNADVGVDGMVINLAGLLAGTATNPFGNGYFQGPAEAPLEAASACTGVYGKGAYPGYAGELLVDKVTGASYNAEGANGRKFLVPSLYDPIMSSCSTMV